MTLLLHGFMGSGADWAGVRAQLRIEGPFLTPDLPGHGEAVELEPEAYSLDSAVDALADLLDGPAVVAGYSMGARVALHLAVRHPDRVGALVLVSGSPGLRTDDERAARRQLDARRAAEITDDFAAFLDAWYRAPLWSGLSDALRVWLLTWRLENDPAELAKALDGMGVGQQPSYWDALADLHCPVWALAGVRDDKYLQLLKEMAEAGPVQPVVVPDAGHALLVEAPEAVADAIALAHGSNARTVAFPSPPPTSTD